MSITNVLNTAVTGLFASQSALRTTANNIVNVNTEGYAREVVRQENIVVGGRSAGVRISDIERIVDRFLQAAGLDARSRTAAADVENQFNQRFQSLLGRPDSQTTIAARMSQLFGVIADLAIDPSGPILRQATLASMQDVAEEISRVSGAIQDLRNDTNQKIQEQVAAVNEALVRIHELNPLIVRQRAVGSESGGLENRRDQALDDLAELIDIRISRSSSGAIGVTTASGGVLLDSSRRELEYNAPGVVTSQTLFNPIQIWRIDNLSDQRIGVPRDIDHQISNGTLRGLLNLRDQDLRDMSLTLGELSATIIDQINAIHNAHSSVPPPNQLTGRQTAFPGTQGHNFTGFTTFAIADSNGQLVQKVVVDYGAVGINSIDDVVTAINAGLGAAGTMSFVNGVMSFTATDPNNGVVIADDPVSPSSRAGQGFSHFFGMNDLLEAAVPVNYDTGLIPARDHTIAAGELVTFEIWNDQGKFLTTYAVDPATTGVSFANLFADLNGSAALGNFVKFSMDGNGALVIAPELGFEDVRLVVKNDSTNVNGTGVSLSALFGIGDRYRVDPSKDVKVIDRISKQPTQMALSSFDLTAGIGAVALSKGDQTGALALQSLETTSVQFSASGDLAGISVTLGQFAAAFYSSAGLKASRAENRAEDQGTLLAEINTRIADVSGVNLDEELANMLVLQNSFNAAARLITTSQEMFDELLSTV